MKKDLFLEKVVDRAFDELSIPQKSIVELDDLTIDELKSVIRDSYSAINATHSMLFQALQTLRLLETLKCDEL